MKRKMLFLLVTAVMLFSIVPFTAFAAVNNISVISSNLNMTFGSVFDPTRADGSYQNHDYTDGSLDTGNVHTVYGGSTGSIWTRFNSVLSSFSTYQITASGGGQLVFYDYDAIMIGSPVTVITDGTVRSLGATYNSAWYLEFRSGSELNAIKEIDVFQTVPDTVAPANVTNLVEAHTQTTVSLGWVKPTDNDLNGYKLYKDNVFVQTLTAADTSVTISGLTGSTLYAFKLTSLDTSGNESTGVTVNATTSAMADTVPPTTPANVIATAGDTTITLTWLAVSAPDLFGYNVYQSLDNVTYNKINGSIITATNYIIPSLVNGTLYYYKVSAVDISSNESLKSSAVNARPVAAATAPQSPNGLSVKVFDSALMINWLSVNGSSGYNVYLNNVKVNSSPITSTGYNATGLTNGTNYAIQVTAVNVVGESPKSIVLNAMPSAEALPYLSFNYNLGDVATGIASWFLSLWRLLAFSVAIPLSFYVGKKVKEFFI